MTHKNTDYWQNKLTLWLHDPICKVFDIPHHEEIARRIAGLLFQSIPEKDNYQAADCIASSLTRAALPDYKDGGGIDFSDNTQITHPLVAKRLTINLPGIDIKKLCEEIESLLKNDLGLDKTFEQLKSLPEDKKPLNAYFNFKDKPEDWAEALFSYLFFAFQRRLRNENVGKLGAIWDILPADTRMPDHPLWHHLGMVSAIGSSMYEDSKNQIDMVVFSITPVQPFITKARKLRDYWSGSVMLSYLSFTGITSVMENLGPDHIVYPSLQNQTLVDSWLEKKFHLGKFLKETGNVEKLISSTEGIAAFPNKFIFLCPHDKVLEMAAEIEKSMQNKWIEISSAVKEKIKKITSAKESFSSLWNTQIEDFWKFSWASSKLAELADKDSLEKLVSGDIVEKEYTLLNSFSANFKNKSARMYTSTHSLVQSVLAAEKNKPSKIKRPQQGIKCRLCGEREVLNDFDFSGKTSAKEYSESVNTFWKKIAEWDEKESENKNIGKNEKLCAVCAVKRFIPIVSNNFAKDSILHGVFKSRNGKLFPSTTQMAATDYIERLGTKISDGLEKEIITFLHNEDNSVEDTTETSSLLKDAEKQGIKYTNKDKYYAVLLMDGDKMGDLINGETLSATWKDILHADLAKKIEDGNVENADSLRKIFDEKRSLNPALHAMISDSLNNFARFGVWPSVKNAKGELIYAGGDDVCAVLPLKNALSCAKKISEAYTLSFAKYTETGAEPIESLDFKDGIEKVGYHLGSGAEKISISGAVIIAHHKEPLREVIQDAHRVLDSVAKEKSGRNAVAVRLKKRSGGDRDFSCKWNDKNIFDEQKTVFDSFMNVCAAAGKNEMSASLLYKLTELKQAFEPLLEVSEGNKKAILQLLKYELSHSGAKKDEKRLSDYTNDVAGICFKESPDGKKLEYNPEAAIIANFLGNDSDNGE